MKNFEKWDHAFRNQNLYEFNKNKNALLWLKIRAICRSKQITDFLLKNGIFLHATTIAEQNIELFETLEKSQDKAMQILDTYLQERNHEWYTSLGIDEDKLKNDLYKIHYYTWGGDQNNSLDKYLISRYVKVISEYDILAKKQSEIADNAWNYVQTSWYNNWTSFLIESLFKRHPKVLSAIGEIKSVDFFIEDNPIDLKVTYFPNQYMNTKLKAKLGKSELAWLKGQAKERSITIDKNICPSQQIYILTEKLAELGHFDVLETLKSKRKEVVLETQDNPIDLMKWLYENQGEMRFGAENRLYIILIDTTDMNQSWKMKRAFSLIEPKIQNYLDDFKANSLKEINFTFKKKTYKSLADIIFIIKK